ncbi:unnamed protein product, partial [Mesocestoides corti]
LYQYNDIHDNADISKVKNAVDRIPLSDCFWYIHKWDPEPHPETGLLSICLRCNDSLPSSFLDNKGFVELKFTLSKADRYADQAPHMFIVSGLAVQIKVTLSRLEKKWTNARWALGIALAANYSLPVDEPFRNSTEINISDESAPGTFEDVVIFLSNRSQTGRRQSYVTWKSVCYVDKTTTDLKNSRALTVSSQGGLEDQLTKALSKSLLPMLIGDVSTNTTTIRQLNLSFGEPGDGFYAASKYIHWYVCDTIKLRNLE